MGSTQHLEETKALNLLENGKEDGYYRNDKCWGSYIHGILDNAEVINDLLKDFHPEENTFDYKSFKEEQYNKLADQIREHIDMDLVYQHLRE